MKCDTCQSNVFDFPTFEDPLAVPHCAEGHWEGAGGEDPEQDPWEACPDYKESEQEWDIAMDEGFFNDTDDEQDEMLDVLKKYWEEQLDEPS